MPSDKEFEAMQRRVEALEGQVGEIHGRRPPSAAQIQDYVKVRDALAGKPVDLSASEIGNYNKVRDFLLDELADFYIPTCGKGPHRRAGDPSAVARMRDLGR
jgi:hypothetical protein